MSSSSSPPSEGEPTTPKVVLKFNASQMAPDIADIFRLNGGPINAMAVDWETDFSISGSEHSEWVACSQGETTQINIDIPESKVSVLPGTYGSSSILSMSSSMRLNFMIERISPAMNGGLGITVACEGSQFLYHILKNGHPVQIPMTYKSFMAHAAVVCVSDARLVRVNADGTETLCTPRFKQDPAESAERAKGVEGLMAQYVNAACRIRQAAVVYKPSPTLHKTVFVDTVGVAGQKLSFLHEIMDRSAHVSLKTIDCLFEASIATNFRHHTDDINGFLADTANPGLPAAKRAGEVATATSLVVNTLMSYRADGRNTVTPTGADFVAVESWNRAVPRGSLETNDCDGLALLAVALLRSCINATSADLGEYPYVNAVRNALYHHYQFGLSVIGASAAEANGADASHSTIAGHAIVLLIPTMSLLKALSRTSSMKIGKDGIPATANGPEIDTLRLRALYHDELLIDLPEEEVKHAYTWESSSAAFSELDAFAIEGTSPATSTLYVKDPEVRADALKMIEKDTEAFARSSPNVMRAFRSMHVGGTPSDEHTIGGPHMLKGALRTVSRSHRCVWSSFV